jgi:hypothetical protein
MFSHGYRLLMGRDMLLNLESLLGTEEDKHLFEEW